VEHILQNAENREGHAWIRSVSGGERSHGMVVARAEVGSACLGLWGYYNNEL
jgi:hypothetical protein